MYGIYLGKRLVFNFVPVSNLRIRSQFEETTVTRASIHLLMLIFRPVSSSASEGGGVI